MNKKLVIYIIFCINIFIFSSCSNNHEKEKEMEIYEEISIDLNNDEKEMEIYEEILINSDIEEKKIDFENKSIDEIESIEIFNNQVDNLDNLK